MMCQNCGKEEATVTYTQVINGVKTEAHLCEKCAKKLRVDTLKMPEFPIDLNSFLGDFFSDYMENELLPSFHTERVKCKTCGMDYDDFIKTGMFGCSNCYTTFKLPIDTLLKNLHGTTTHIGRKPKSIKEPIKVNKESTVKEGKEDNITKLQKDLEKAIKEENYEEAAKIRDEIKKLKSE